MYIYISTFYGRNIQVLYFLNRAYIRPAVGKRFLDGVYTYTLSTERKGFLKYT